jgi:hypothetical protein
MKTTRLKNPTTRKRSAAVSTKAPAADDRPDLVANALPQVETPKSSSDTKFYFKIHLNNRFSW